MRVSFKWLQEYVQVDLTPQELARKLTMAGLEVEEVESTLPAFNGIIVAKVLQVNKHPNADRLSICEVSTGREKLQVVCGAPNVAAGQIVAFAPVGVSPAQRDPDKSGQNPRCGIFRDDLFRSRISHLEPC